MRLSVIAGSVILALLAAGLLAITADALTSAPFREPESRTPAELVAEKERQFASEPDGPGLLERIFGNPETWPAPAGVNASAAFWLGLAILAGAGAYLALSTTTLIRRSGLGLALFPSRAAGLVVSGAQIVSLLAVVGGLFLVAVAFSDTWGRDRWPTTAVRRATAAPALARAAPVQRRGTDWDAGCNVRRRRTKTAIAALALARYSSCRLLLTKRTRSLPIY